MTVTELVGWEHSMNNEPIIAGSTIAAAKERPGAGRAYSPQVRTGRNAVLLHLRLKNRLTAWMTVLPAEASNCHSR